LSEYESLPIADYYLAFDFLEHLPSKEYADSIVKLMATRSTVAVWLRMPSFEPDFVSGEGVLRLSDLRFSWTNWTGHPTPYLVSQAVGALFPFMSKVVVCPSKLVHSTEDDRIVPIDSPIDTVSYHKSLGNKINIAFSPPLVRAWDVIGIK